MRITDLRTMHLDSPLGYAISKPTFSWIVTDTNSKRQLSAQIKVAADQAMQHIIYDSGEGDHSSLGHTVDMPLQPRTRYWWQVTVKGDCGDVGTSEPAWFETGKMDEPWQGDWIAAPAAMHIHPVFGRRFSITKSLSTARLYICGLGMYEARMNDQPVSDEHFAPFYDSYDHHIQYQTYDVTHLLHADNELSITLGGGWYCSRFGFEYPHGKLYGDRMQLLAELHITYVDGTHEIIATGDDWTCHPSAITDSSIYDGEHYDARLEDSCDDVAVECVAPPAGRLIERISPPVRITEERSWVELIHTPADEWVLDFGQVMTGWVSFVCNIPKDRKVYMQYGELLQNDCFFHENLRTAKTEYSYISNGRSAFVRPHFTFYGFRFVKIEGLSKEEILQANFRAHVIHSDLLVTGTFITDHPKVNQLIRNAVWSQRGNFLDIPTDCPQRDERMGWTGDAQVFCPTASYNMYTPAFYRKYLINMRAEQSMHSGAVPHVVPDVINAMNRRRQQDDPTYVIPNEFGSCAWGDAATVIPWTLYQFFGDLSLLKETYPGMKAWVDWIHSQDVNNCHESHLWSCGFHFADWLALDNPDPNSCFGGTENTYIATAYYFRSAELTAKAAHALGYAEDHAYYASLAEQIRQAFQDHYFTSGSCTIQTQTALALALHWNLAPESCRSTTLLQLKNLLASRNDHLDTGFVGTPVLLPVLSENGLHELAVTLLLQEDYPSWLYEINMGATTIWERWNSVMPDGLVSSTGMNSMNHYAYGSVLGWMYAYLGGIKPSEDSPGFKHAIIAPQVDKRLKHIECNYHSASGPYSCSWEIKGHYVYYSITVPFDCSADIILGKDPPISLSAGQYSFTRPL